MVEFGGIKEGLAWDATNVEAGAAEVRVFFDDCDFEAELSCADGGYVATWACADYDDVKSVVCHIQVI